MAQIRSPKTQPSDPDHSIECQEAMEDAFLELVNRGVKAGWNVEQVISAVIELADTQMVLRQEDARVEGTLRRMRKDPTLAEIGVIAFVGIVGIALLATFLLSIFM